MTDSCCGEFYADPPEDHIFRYKWAAEKLKGFKGIVFDIGCGSGYGSKILQDSGLSVVGLDRSIEAIRMASEKVTAYFMNVTPVSDGFQRPHAVVLMEVIEHNVHGIGIVKRLRSKADIILASVPYKEKPGGNEYHKLFNLSANSFRWMTPRPLCIQRPEAPDSLLIEWRREWRSRRRSQPA